MRSLNNKICCNMWRDQYHLTMPLKLKAGPRKIKIKIQVSYHSCLRDVPIYMQRLNHI